MSNLRWLEKVPPTTKQQSSHILLFVSPPYHPCIVYLTYIWLIVMVHVCKYTIHGCYGSYYGYAKHTTSNTSPTLTTNQIPNCWLITSGTNSLIEINVCCHGLNVDLISVLYINDFGVCRAFWPRLIFDDRTRHCKRSWRHEVYRINKNADNNETLMRETYTYKHSIYRCKYTYFKCVYCIYP